MIIVDNALRAREAEGRPVRVGMIGAGFMAQGLANQIIHSVPGMEMTAVYGRQLERALHVYRYSGRMTWSSRRPWAKSRTPPKPAVRS